MEEVLENYRVIKGQRRRQIPLGEKPDPSRVV
jgi:hypothetical protein